jgi:hypothetical protein
MFTSVRLMPLSSCYPLFTMVQRSLLSDFDREMGFSLSWSSAIFADRPILDRRQNAECGSLKTRLQSECMFGLPIDEYSPIVSHAFKRNLLLRVVE